MGNGGKQVERQRARELRAAAWTLREIADELGVSKGSVSVWVRDVEFVPKPRNRGHLDHRPHPLHVRKLAEIERCRVEAETLLGPMSERDLTMFCLALYAGEGSKTDGAVKFANTNPTLSKVFITWLRRAFDIDESRLRITLYLHSDLDLDLANEFWSCALSVPIAQFPKAYRAAADGTIRNNRHIYGCATIGYSCRLTHRRVMAMIQAVTSPFALPG